VNLLETKELSKSFGETHAVDKVDFQIQEGEVLSLIGSNGAGKTSMVNLISGLLHPDSGRIVFRGQDITTLPVHGRIKAGIARSFQIVNLFDELTLHDNVALSIFSRRGMTRRLFTLADRHHEVWDEALEILRQFGWRRSARSWPASSRRVSASCSTWRSPTHSSRSSFSSTSPPAG